MTVYKVNGEADYVTGENRGPVAKLDTRDKYGAFGWQQRLFGD